MVPIPPADALDPRLRERLASATPARDWVLGTLARAWASPERATGVLREASRDARKLRSRERRALWDALYTLIRFRGVLGPDWADALDRWLAGERPTGRDFAAWADVPGPVGDALTRGLGVDATRWLDASNARAPTVLRANRARVSAERLIARLAEEGIAARALGGDALALDGPANALGTRAFHAGLFEVQDLGSQRIAAAVDGSGHDVLDLCAGAGGKALALAAAGARVTAADVRRRALDELVHRARRAGATIEVVHLARGDELAGRRFARVLVDAPCSGSGVWRRHPENRWRLHPVGALSGFVDAQQALLARALAHVAPGGRVIYATCSSIDAENAGVVDAFLAAHPGWSRVAPDVVTGPHAVGPDAGPHAVGPDAGPHAVGPDGMYAATMGR